MDVDGVRLGFADGAKLGVIEGIMDGVGFVDGAEGFGFLRSHAEERMLKKKRDKTIAISFFIFFSKNKKCADRSQHTKTQTPFVAKLIKSVWDKSVLF